MADYKELLRRAISALPENNGAARRAVYEKARSALVGQLRAIQPPLPAREITQHRLQLEDCIRQVEQEASEAVINLGRDSLFSGRSAPSTPAESVEPKPQAPEPEAPVPPPAAPVAAPAEAPEAEEEVEPEPQPAPLAKPVAAPPPPANPLSIEEIISEAATTRGVKVERVDAAEPGRPNEADGNSDEFVPPAEPVPLKRPSLQPRRDSNFGISGAASPAYSGTPIITRVEPAIGATALARQPENEDQLDPVEPRVEAALSSVREVEVDNDEAREAEGFIERAIETLDREARGESTETLPEGKPFPAGVIPPEAEDNSDPAAFDTADGERRSGAGMTIFLIVFALLLAGAGGAGFWAWREGYVDLDQMFGQADVPAVTQTADTPVSPSQPDNPADPDATGPGNTATTGTAEPTTAIEGIDLDDRLEPTPEAVTPSGNEPVLPSLNGGEPKTEERLSGAETSIAAVNDPANSVDPDVLAGSQSLLLEASADGRTGAVPFSGTVEWTRGEDELGLPTLVGEASIPARNLNVQLTIRKNGDPSLPASHLVEVSFDVNDTFVGGSISSLPGILLKNEELVPGEPLAGASARVLGNSFLFALSASPDQQASNVRLLESRRWLDLAIVYGTGRNAILTLEKDQEAQGLFSEVFTAWAE